MKKRGAQDHDADGRHGDDGVLGFGELLLQYDSAPQQGGHTIGGDHGGGHDDVVPDGEDVGELAGGLTEGRRQLVPLPALRPDLLLFDEHHVDEGEDSHHQEGELIGDIGLLLGDDGPKQEAVHEGAQAVDEAVEERKGDGDDAFGVLGVGRKALRGPESVVLPFFDDRQGKDAGAHQNHAEKLKARHSLAQKEEAQNGGHRAGGIADGGGDGQLDVPKAHIPDDHGEDIAEGGGQVGDDVPQREGGAGGDEDDGMGAHHEAHGHDHLPMTVLIVGLGAHLGEEIGAAPEKNGDQGQDEPIHIMLSFQIVNSFSLKGQCGRRPAGEPGVVPALDTFGWSVDHKAKPPPFLGLQGPSERYYTGFSTSSQSFSFSGQ